MTPPLDEEEEDTETRLLEAEARRELERDGCPPCYPADLHVPIRNPPEKYEPIIRYWQSFPGTGDVVLRAQLHDWRNFRVFQSSARHRRRNGGSNQVGNRASGRLSRCELGVNADLRPVLKEPIWLDDWEDFQKYQHHRLGRFAAKLDKLEKELNETRRRPGDRSDQAAEYVSQEADVVQHLFEVAQQDLERHKILLQWIEQERHAMVCGQDEPSQRDGQGAQVEVIRRGLRGCRPRQSVCSTLLGKSKILKATPKRRYQGKGHVRSCPEPGDQNQTNDPNHYPSGISGQCAVKSGRAQTTPVNIVPRQLAYEMRRSADIGRSSRPGRHLRGNPQVRSLQQGRAGVRHVSRPPYSLQPVCKVVTTRSGRKSRPPVKWAPG